LHVKAPVLLYALAPAFASLATGCSLEQFRKDPVQPVAVADTCETRAMVDDAEDRNDQILVRQGRGGYIYTYLDKAGSTITPDASTFKMARGGAHGSKYAARIQGKLATSGETFAGMGMDLRYPRRPYDASRYKGVSFLAKVSKGTSPFVRFKMPDANTDPDAKQCTECYNDFGIGVELSEEWTRYEVAFSELKQESGWGNPRPPNVDAKKLMSLQWQVSAPGTAFDIWIDDVSFIGCP
jgi:endoglucanase